MFREYEFRQLFYLLSVSFQHSGVILTCRLTVSEYVLSAVSSLCVPICIVLSYSRKPKEGEIEAMAPVFVVFCKARSARSV